MKENGEIRIQWNAEDGRISLYKKCMTGDLPEALAQVTLQILHDIALDGKFSSLLMHYVIGLIAEAGNYQPETVTIDLSGGREHGEDA